MWLRYERECPVVCMERGNGRCGVPDVMGLTVKRRIIEIEIKRSMQDFRHNERKWMARARARMQGFYLTTHIQQFYFMVENEMVEKCKLELPEWAGLMSPPMPDEYSKTYNDVPFPVVRVPAPMDKSATKVTLKGCVRMAKHQSGTLSSVLNQLARERIQMQLRLVA